MTTAIRANRAPQILKAIARGTARALTRSMEHGKTHATRAVAQNVGARQAAVRRHLILDKASAQQLNTTLRFTGKRLRIVDLGARETKKGVTYRVEGGGRGLIPGAFFAKVGSGRKPHQGVFVRVLPTLSRKGKRRGAPALHIQEKYAVSVPFVAIENQILESTLAAAEADFPKNAAHEIGRAVSGAD